MLSAAGSVQAEEPDEGAVPLGLQEFVLHQTDGSADFEYSVGVFVHPSSGVRISVVIITIVSDLFLVAVPSEAWHRLKAQRVLPDSPWASLID